MTAKKDPRDCEGQANGNVHKTELGEATVNMLATASCDSRLANLGHSQCCVNVNYGVLDLIFAPDVHIPIADYLLLLALTRSPTAFPAVSATFWS